MKGAVFVLLIALQTTLATFDVEGLKAKAATNLQTLTSVASDNLQKFTETASEKLQNLHQKAATKLQELTENASNNLHDIADSIDLEKLKTLDFLHILPRVHDHDRLVHSTGPTHKDKIYLKTLHGAKEHLNTIKGLHIKGDDLKLAFEGKYPWPVKTRRIVYIYE